MAAKERIKRARITHISLCPRGKNRLRATFHAVADDEIALDFRALACMGEEGLLTACVYLPEAAGVPDTMGRVIDGPALIDCAHNWLTEVIEGRGGIDIRHDFKALPSDAVQICESFIIQKGDPRFAHLRCEGKPVDATGGWGAVFKIHDAKLRELYRKGEWEAVSMAGLAEVEPIQMADFSSKQRDKLADSGAAMPDGSFPIRNTQDLRNAIQAFGRAQNKAAVARHILKRARALGATALLPDAGDLHDLIERERHSMSAEADADKGDSAAPEADLNSNTQPMDQDTKDLLKGLAEGMKALLANSSKQPVKAEDNSAKIAFEGDANDPKALEAHEEKLMLASCDLSTSEGIAKWRKHLAEKAKRTQAPASPTNPANPANPGVTRQFQFAAGTDDDEKSMLAAGKAVIVKLNASR